MPSTILIADQDPVQRRQMDALIRRIGHRAEMAGTAGEALARLGARDLPPISLLILDLRLPDLEPAAFLTHLRERRAAVPVIVQCASPGLDRVESALRAGASDFLVTPVGIERLQVAIGNALRMAALQAEAARSGPPQMRTASFQQIITRCDAMERAVRLGERAARSHLPALLEGEAGVGKRFFARAIHAASDRRGRAFVTIDCAAHRPDEAEALLFGADGGDRRVAKLIEAQGGTLFVENVGAASASAQARLARVLQDGELRVAGARRPMKIDVRVISSSGEHLIERVKAGLFREDLYYRLNVFPIALPPLRARRADIGDLARRFAQRVAVEEGRILRGVCAEAIDLLERYDWPGNVRQLENAVFRAVALCQGDELGVAEFPQIAARVAGFEVRVPPAPASAPPLRLAPAADVARLHVRDPHAIRLLDENGNVRKLEEVETEAIRFALAHYRGQMSEMARRLGIGRSTLYRKLKDLGLYEAETEDERTAAA